MDTKLKLAKSSFMIQTVKLLLEVKMEDSTIKTL